MTKQQLLDLLKLLSALESWSFSNKHTIPDYLLQRMDSLVAELEKEILK